jgi:prolyl-tRNA synthetase
MQSRIARTIHFIGQGWRLFDIADCGLPIADWKTQPEVEKSFPNPKSAIRNPQLRRWRRAVSLAGFMKLWSQFFIPTLKESPADAEIASHKLLVRAGLVRKLGGGLYTYMPFGLRAIQKITQICREEMDAAGAIELWMPHVHPAELWEQGPRWAAAREIMFRADSAGNGKRAPRDPEFVLGPTHEEIITPLVKTEITSYRDLPKNFYQIATKFRNEIRPRYGLMRAREFIMMDSYSFDTTDDGAVKSYHAMKAAYESFFKRLGVQAIAVEADTGVMGGSFSHEFMVPAEIGDDDVIYNETSGYAANREKATSALVPANLTDAAANGAVEEFATPGVVTIAALEAAPYSVAADKQFKTLVYVGDGKPFLVILRGCDDLEEAKLGALGFTLFRPATPEEIEPVMGAKPGSLGAVKGTIKAPAELAGIFADHAIRLIGNGTTGANKDGFHLRNVNVTRDLAITTFGDFRRVRPGEPDPRSGQPLQVRRGIEVGHIFKLGTKYSEKFNAVYTDDQKQSHLMVMGCYGIGISRTMQAIIEQSHDTDGIVWPWNCAPFQVLVCVLDPQVPEAMELAKKLGAAAEGAGADVLIDDRVERPGVKFKDADLIGIPLRLTVGGKGMKEGVIELKWRAQKDVVKVPIAEAEARIANAVREAQAKA